MRIESNRYARLKGVNLNVTVDEVKVFISILLLSGYVDVPRFKMFWEDSETRIDLVANAMRRDRFIKIKKYFHLADNENLDQNDKFSKLRPYFDILQSNFLQHAVLDPNVSVDESMSPYFGKHSGKQFIKGKPIR